MYLYNINLYRCSKSCNFKPHKNFPEDMEKLRDGKNNLVKVICCFEVNKKVLFKITFVQHLKNVASPKVLVIMLINININKVLVDDILGCHFTS